MANPRDSIITLPHPHLHERSKKVGIITTDIQELVQKMEATLLDWEAHREHEVGVALAAIQIDKALRVIVVRNDFNNKEDKTFGVFINPTVTKYEGELVEDFEGCLSIQDMYGRVPRYSKVRIKAQDLSGKEVRLKMDGFLARTFQHEIDHTNGIMFADHIKNKPEAFFMLNTKGELEPADAKELKANHILG
jgi:peptide deformylase